MKERWKRRGGYKRSARYGTVVEKSDIGMEE